MSYWTNRQEQLKEAAEKDEAKIKKRLSSFYDSEFRRLDKEIAAYFAKYGAGNVIEYRVLMQSLPDEDKRLLMEQMDEFARKYPQYADLMPVRESIYRLDRLQGLQYSVYMAQANIAGYTDGQVREYETTLAHKGLNYAMETLGFGKNFYSINSDVVRQFVGVAWSNGENFSMRIWNDTQKLAGYLNQEMAQMFARGESYDRMARDLQRRFDRVNRNNAYRLVYTEGTYVMAESTMQPFSEDFEQYRISPVLDGKTCPICRGLRKRAFLISERHPGVNFPPIHPWCRCTFEIVVEDWDAWIDGYVAKHSGNIKQAEEIANRISSGIIELTRKANKSRKGFKFISDETFNNLTISARKKGAIIIRGTREAEEHLDKVGAAASIVGDVLIFRKNVCISEVLEETYHFEQNLSEANNDKPEPLRSILNEIAAKEYLLENSRKYNIPRNEVELTQRQLESYRKRLIEYQEGGE